MKRYFVKYTIYDGEYEYGDNAIFSTDISEDDIKNFTIDFTKRFWDAEEIEWDSDLSVIELSDGRNLGIDSFVEVPDEDYVILCKYL